MTPTLILTNLEKIVLTAQMDNSYPDNCAMFAATDVLLQRLEAIFKVKPKLYMRKASAEIAEGIARLTGFAPAGSTRHADAQMALNALQTLKINIGDLSQRFSG